MRADLVERSVAAATTRLGATTNVPPPRPRRDSTSPASRSALIASRSVTRLTPKVVGELAFGRQPLTPDEHAEPDALGQALDRHLEGVAYRHRREDRPGPQRLDVAGGRSSRGAPRSWTRRPRASAPRGAGVDERGRTAARAVVHLGMPLHADRPRSRSADLDRLDRAVVGPAGGDESVRRAGRPPGDGRSRRRCAVAEPSGDPAAGRRAATSCRPCTPTVGQCESSPTTSGRCWTQVPPSATVEHLHAAADAEHRQVAPRPRPATSAISQASRSDRGRPGLRVARRVVPRRVDVRAAGEHQAVRRPSSTASRPRRSRVDDRRWQQQRHAAGARGSHRHSWPAAGRRSRPRRPRRPARDTWSARSAAAGREDTVIGTLAAPVADIERSTGSLTTVARRPTPRTDRSSTARARPGIARSAGRHRRSSAPTRVAVSARRHPAADPAVDAHRLAAEHDRDRVVQHDRAQPARRARAPSPRATHPVPRTRPACRASRRTRDRPRTAWSRA